MKTITLLQFSLLYLVVTFLPLSAYADENAELIQKARSAAPSMISANATVISNGQILAEGTNGWTCMPETMPGDNSPHCSDKLWMELFKAFGAKAPFTADTIGFSYMLGGDGGVSNSDPYHPNPASAHDFIKEGPHLMLIVPAALLKDYSDDPGSGEPYVMWKDTPYAHIMVPVGER